MVLCLSRKWVKLDKIMYCNVPQTDRHNLRRQKCNVPGRQHDLTMHLKLAGRTVALQAKQFGKSGFLQITEIQIPKLYSTSVAADSS